MSDHIIKNIDSNVVKIGKTQDSKFQELSQKLQTIEQNQNLLNGNMKSLYDKLDYIIDILDKNFPE